MVYPSAQISADSLNKLKAASMHFSAPSKHGLGAKIYNVHRHVYTKGIGENTLFSSLFAGKNLFVVPTEVSLFALHSIYKNIEV